ncbi:hypothetical protein FA10DRAFT_265018 [Acaromyces ingoldii]|uniref:RNA polymerase Rpb4/RPC9 core domain-containing protein n=1 Tax=Acaromyces ingoldii TaxID=215250 RepID=A0A316YPC7_9BASI|nr:hypothetical protein FA10DRAFT_265018 [Acaromyces ingoldii]PWN91139.1 hypothetical protein FA10DRAFT_265018 [Acaromyces ingoldii]
MTSRLGQRRRRDRREEDADATLGRLGPEFNEEQLAREGGGALMLSEVRLLMQRAAEGDKSEEPGNRDPNTMPTFKKCYEYVDMFSKYRDEEVARSARKELDEYGYFEQYDEEGNVLPADESRLMLTRFEMAQLANLSIESVEEAKVLIPTLGAKDDQQLESLLNELATKRKFQA